MESRGGAGGAVQLLGCTFVIVWSKTATPTRVKLAVTVLLPSITTEQLVPRTEEQPPLQPANTEPAAGIAVSLNVVPAEYREHPAPHEAPTTSDATDPVPVPVITVVSVNVPGGGSDRGYRSARKAESIAPMFLGEVSQGATIERMVDPGFSRCGRPRTCPISCVTTD